MRRQHTRRRLLRRADLHHVLVLDVRMIRNAMILAVGITASHAILIRVGSEDAVRDLDRETADGLSLPLIDYDGRPALVLRVDDPPAGLSVGDVLDLQVRFTVDLAFDIPLVEAVAHKIFVRRPQRRVTGITLPSIGMPAP